MHYLEVTSSSECQGDDINVTITNKSFYSFKDTAVNSLVLRGCAFNSIQSGSLTYFKQLTQINLACTQRLNFTAVMYALQSTLFDTIETIIFDGMIMEGSPNFCHKKRGLNKI